MVVLWCSGYYYCTTPFSSAWTQVLCRFKPCPQCVGDKRWWGSLKMVWHKAQWVSSVNYTTKTIHHHHQTIHRCIIIEDIENKEVPYKNIRCSLPEVSFEKSVLHCNFLKLHFHIGVFLKTCWIFAENLFRRTPLGNCFWKMSPYNVLRMKRNSPFVKSCISYSFRSNIFPFSS